MNQTHLSKANVETCSADERHSACVRIHPGVCGFECLVEAHRIDSRTVSIRISGSDCKQIQRLAERLKAMSLRELFSPLTRNPVYVCAEQSGCHPSCVVPTGVLKAVEAAMGMALPREVRIQFVCQDETP